MVKVFNRSQRQQILNERIQSGPNKPRRLEKKKKETSQSRAAPHRSQLCRAQVSLGLGACPGRRQQGSEHGGRTHVVSRRVVAIPFALGFWQY
jgi:hypothetical protein